MSVSSPLEPAYAVSSFSGWSATPTCQSSSAHGSIPTTCQPGAVVWKSRRSAWYVGKSGHPSSAGPIM